MFSRTGENQLEFEHGPLTHFLKEIKTSLYIIFFKILVKPIYLAFVGNRVLLYVIIGVSQLLLPVGLFFNEVR